jgi:hypothetical protein
VPDGWTSFPGDGKAVWEADFNHRGKIDFGSTIDLFSGRLVLRVKRQTIVTEFVTHGTVVWPPSAISDLGCGEGMANVTVSFKSRHGRPASFVACLHDLPAGSVVPPKIWGTLSILKSEMDEDNHSPEDNQSRE